MADWVESTVPESVGELEQGQLQSDGDGAAVPLQQTRQAPGAGNIDLLMDVSLPLSVRLGKAKMTVREILSLGPGSVIELDKAAGEPVDLYVNEKLIARGEVVVIDENFGIRIVEIFNNDDEGFR